MAESILRSILKRRGRTDIEVFSAGVKDYTDLEPIDKAVSICEKFDTPIRKKGATFMDDLDLDSMSEQQQLEAQQRHDERERHPLHQMERAMAAGSRHRLRAGAGGFAIVRRVGQGDPIVGLSGARVESRA